MMKAGLESLESLHRCKQVCNEKILWDMDEQDKEEEKSLLLNVEITNATTIEYHIDKSSCLMTWISL